MEDLEREFRGVSSACLAAEPVYLDSPPVPAAKEQLHLKLPSKTPTMAIHPSGPPFLESIL